MEGESIAFGLAVIGMFAGAIVLVFGVFRGGMTPTAAGGSVIALLSIAWLAYLVSSIE